jgi:hypothetical protein
MNPLTQSKKTPILPLPIAPTMARRALALAASLGLLLGVALSAAAQNPNAQNLYSVHKLVSDVPGEAAITDSDLVNGWGISHGLTSPWWVSNEGTDTSTLYNGKTSVAKVPLTVAVEGGPTGQVRNDSTDFKVDAGTVDVFNGTWGPGNLPGTFTDQSLPEGYAPFGIQAIGSLIFVAYAKQDPDDPDEELHGEGLGYVDAFDTAGNFIERVASASELNAPWGLAMAPSNFGKFSGDLLVGNLGDGRIHAFRKGEDGWEEHGVMKGTDHKPIEIDGLWGIGFGNGDGAGPTNTLFFAAGPDDETHGLFGSITAP